jgi:hypothetical protein
MKIPNQVIAFAGENLSPYKMFVDYYNHYLSENGVSGKSYQTHVMEKGVSVPISFAQKEEKMNKALLDEILRVSGISGLTQFPLETWANHPSLKWAAFAVVSAMIDMILPEAVIDSVGLYSEVRTIGWGDSAAFDVKPRDIFTVSKAGKAKRLTELHKQFVGQVTVMPEPRELTVFVSLTKVLAGKESLADFTAKAVRSFETQLSYDIYNAMATQMAALDTNATTGLRVAGYTQDDFVRLSQVVGAWNGGAKPIAIGTQLALSKILPSNANYRYEIDSDFVKVGYLRNFQGTDIMVIPQIADWTTPFGVKLDNTKIWLVSPSSQKIVKVVLEGNTLAYNSDTYAYANLLQTSTLTKYWGTAIATNAVAAEIDM